MFYSFHLVMKCLWKFYEEWYGSLDVTGSQWPMLLLDTRHVNIRSDSDHPEQ